MCGIVGFWGPPESGLLGAMAAGGDHPGPEDDDFFEQEHASIGYRRPAIAGTEHQQRPMATDDGSLQLVFDGEFYNSQELRADLSARGHTFRTGSDSEIMLRVYEEYGPDGFAVLNGIWAMAVLDARDRQHPRLVLSRDHLGVKPLYYAHSEGRILFGSDIKSVLQDPALQPEPDDQQIYEYLIAGLQEHGVNTFFRGIKRLPAAHYAVLDANEFVQDPYWQPQLQDGGCADPGELRELLEQAVERRLPADTPVGASLTGGLDTAALDRAAIAGLAADVLHRQAAEDSTRQLALFAAVPDEDSGAQDLIADITDATGAAHSGAPFTSTGLFDELEQLVWHQEEPMGNAGAYAEWCLMRQAADGATVLLDGQGGAELFAGGTTYQRVYRRQLLRQRRYRDLLTRTWSAKGAMLPRARDKILSRSKQIRPADFLKPSFTTTVTDPDDQRSQDDLKLRMLQDLTRYRLPALLRYTDRNGTAFSVGSRQPFLDPDVVNWILKAPSDSFIRNGMDRALLRAGLQDVLPEKIRRGRSENQTESFETRWLKVRRARIQSMLRSPQFCGRKYWHGLQVADAFAAACAGKADLSLFFWRALNVEVWLRVFFDNDGDPGQAAAGIRAQPDRQADGPLSANPGKSLMIISDDGAAYLRGPVKTRTVQPGDDLEELIRDSLPKVDGEVWLRPGDTLAISEKVVAISQGRSFPVDSLQPRPLARVLSRFVSRTPVGIGVGVPATMELAFREAGTGRILFAAAASAITRPFGIKGVFYRVAGSDVRAIDGPTEGTLPPSNTHAKLPPCEPDQVADRLSDWMSELAGGRVDVVIVDANDLGVETLGSSAQADPRLVASLMRDNPLGQGSEQTPIALIRRCETSTTPPDE